MSNNNAQSQDNEGDLNSSPGKRCSFLNALRFQLNKIYTHDSRFLEVDGAGSYADKEKVRITQMYLCNANKMN